MKNLIKGTAFLILAITFAACQQVSDPVSPVSLDKNNAHLSTEAGTRTGTFEITLPSYRAADEPATIMGSISFRFDDAASVYKYRGSIITPSRYIYSGTFENTGAFERKGNYISLIDNPVTEETPGLRTLYLNGNFYYIVRGTQTIIEGDTKMGHLKIILD